MGGKVSLYYDGESFGYMYKSYKAQSCRSIFTSLMKPHTDFHRSYTSLPSHQQRIIFSLIDRHPFYHVMSFVLFILAIVSEVRWNLCISRMAKYAEHFFKSLLVIFVSSLKDSLFSSIPQFLIIFFNFLGVHFLCSS